MWETEYKIKKYFWNIIFYSGTKSTRKIKFSGIQAVDCNNSQRNNIKNKLHKQWIQVLHERLISAGGGSEEGGAMTIATPR